MAAFTLALGGSPIVQDWTDEMPGLDPPARLNSPAHPHRYKRFNGAAPVLVEITPSEDTAEEYEWWWSHRGEGPSPSIVVEPGEPARITLAHDNLGTWVLTAYRAGMGSVSIGFSYETAEA